MDLKRAVRGIIIAALLSVLVYAALLAFSDFRSVAAALRRLPLSTLAAMIALTLGCYLMRALRWGLLARANGGSVTARDAIWVQFSGMTMTVTPGKLGEILKAFLGRELHGLPTAKGVTLVFVERLTDLAAVVILSVGGLSVLGHAVPLIVFGIAVVAGVIVLSSPPFHRLALSVVERQSWAKAHRHSAQAVSEALSVSLSPLRATLCVLLGGIAWAMEGIALWLSVSPLGSHNIGIVTAVGIYAVSAIAGALTFMPGGIGLTEASLAGLLVAAGVGSAGASAATLLIRVVTLWMGVALGWAALALRPDMLRRVVSPGRSDA